MSSMLRLLLTLVLAAGASVATTTAPPRAAAAAPATVAAVGHIDEVTYDPFVTGPGTMLVRGWAYDEHTPDRSMQVRVATPVAPGPPNIYQTPERYRETFGWANESRPDVNRALGITGSHGFRLTVPIFVGTFRMCLTPADVDHHALFCRDVTTAARSPIGTLESVSAVAGGVRVKGWSFDPDDVSSLLYSISANGAQVAAGRANDTRPDVAVAYPKHGAEHGFDTTFPLPAGRATVCVTTGDESPPRGAPLGCRTVTVSRDHSPVGRYDTLTDRSGTLVARGWATDPDTGGTVTVRATFAGDGSTATTVADAVRPHFLGTYRAKDARHGFSVALPVPFYRDGARYTLCVAAIDDDPAGAVTELGCRTVSVTVSSRTPIQG